jgi:hypothetical protein
MYIEHCSNNKNREKHLEIYLIQCSEIKRLIFSPLFSVGKSLFILKSEWQLNSGMFSKLLDKEDAEGYHDTAYYIIRTLSFTNSGALPKYSKKSSFIFVQDAGHQGSDISTCTYKQQDYSQQTLNIENGRHSEASDAPATSHF